jgi:hypothetical protein
MYNHPQLRTLSSARAPTLEAVDLEALQPHVNAEPLQPPAHSTYNDAILRLHSTAHGQSADTRRQAGLALTEEQPLWLTDLGREAAAAAVVAAEEIGAFVVRTSSRPRAWAVTVQHPGKVLHHLAEQTRRGFIVDDQPTNCATLEEVVALLQKDGSVLGTKLTRSALGVESAS